MLGKNTRRVLVPAALAGISASALALSAGPGPSPTAGCPTPKVEAARLALLAHCISASNELAGRANRAVATERRCGADRPITLFHPVCYAAILPDGRETNPDQ